MKHFTKLFIILLLTLQTSVFAQVSGDFRSKSSGDWGSYSIWQVYNGSTWVDATAGQVPVGISESNSNSVYIESGHTVTLSSEQGCKDLHLNTTADVVRINTQDNALNVWGKMRFYEGTAPGSSTPKSVTSSGITGWISTSSNGYIRFRGTADRIIIADGQVNSNNTNSGWNLDFAFEPGFTGEIQERLRAGNITVSSGILYVSDPFGELRVGTNNGASDLTPNGSFLVKSGATANGGAGIFKKANVAAANITVESGGNLIITQNNFVLAAVSLDLSGTITLQNAINFPTEAGRANAASVNTFANLTVEGTGIKTLQNDITVNGTLSIKETASLGGSFGVNYEGDATLEYMGSTNQTTSDIEFPITNSPPNLIINNPNGVSLHSSRTISNQLTLTSGLLYLGNHDLTLGANSPAVAGTPSASNMVVTDGTGKLNKIFSSTGSYLFPIGDTTGLHEYSPSELRVVSAAELNGTTYIGSRVINTKHPSVTGTSDYISRHWEVNSNMSQYSYNGTFQYLTEDVTGVESTIKTIIFENGTASSSKVVVGTADATLHQIQVTDAAGNGYVSGANLVCQVLNNTISSQGQSEICSTVSFSLNGQPAVVTSGTPTYQWQRKYYPDLSDNWINLENGQSEDFTETDTLLGLYQYRRIVTDPSICYNGNQFASNLLFINFLERTNILSNPSNSLICVNSNTSFTISATGYNLTYRWQASIDGGSTYHDLSDGSIHSNTNTTTLNISNAPSSIHNYKYRCKIMGECGTYYTTSATLTVNIPPTIVKNVSNKAICAGNNLTFGVQATGSNLTYQWQVSTDGGEVYSNLNETAIYSNVTSPTLSISNASDSQNGYKYRCVVSSPACSNAISSIATLTVYSLPNITLQSSDVSSCEGGSFNVSVEATGSNLSYQWQASVNGGVSYTNISNGSTYNNTQSSTLSVSSVIPNMNNYKFRCKITNQCSTIYSTPVELTLTSALITSNPQNKYICPGIPTSFSVLASGSGLSYQWQVSTNGGDTYNTLSESAIYSGVTSSVLNLTGAVSNMNNYKYRCIVTANCGSPMISASATLYLYNALSISLNPSDLTISSGSTGSFSVSASGQEISYLWYVSTDGGNNFYKLSNGTVHKNVTTPTLTIASASLSMNNYRYKCKITSKCSTEFSGNAVLTVTNGGAKLASLDEESLEIHAYPNPFDSEVSIAISGNEDVNLIVKDLTGKQILYYTDIPSNSILKLGDSLQSGIYILEVNNSKEKKTIKIIKN